MNGMFRMVKNAFITLDRNRLICFVAVALLISASIIYINPSKRRLQSALTSSAVVDTTTKKYSTTTFDFRDITMNATDLPNSTLPTTLQKHMNILFIVSDDLRPQLNSYKGRSNPNPLSEMKTFTNNLDALSARSLQLNRAYVQFSVCSPSRSSYMTSRKPDTTKVWNLRNYWRETGGNFTSIPQFFKERGYQTRGLGKIYHVNVGRKDPPSWTHEYTTIHNKLYKPRNVSWWAVPEEISKKQPLDDEAIAIEALRFLGSYARDAKTKQPFFLAVGFKKPHIPFVFPERYMDHYPLNTVKLTDNPSFPKNFPDIAKFKDEPKNYIDMGSYNGTLPEYPTKLLRRAYLSCVTYIDDMVGQLLDGLRSFGLDKNTIVTFIGDHGYHLGENGMWGKHTNMEQATHTPMIVHIPGRTDQGIKSDSFVEFLDLFPTLVEAAGFDPLTPCPKDSSSVELCTEGQSFLELVDNPDRVLRTAVFSQMARKGTVGYTLRTNRWRFVIWAKVTRIYLSKRKCRVDIDWESSQTLGLELYDHYLDPEENKNLANNGRFGRLLEEFTKEVQKMVDYPKTTQCNLIFNGI